MKCQSVRQWLSFLGLRTVVRGGVSELLASPSELFASPSELLASHSAHLGDALQQIHGRVEIVVALVPLA
jgi:hypothetical protein